MNDRQLGPVGLPRDELVLDLLLDVLEPTFGSGGAVLEMFYLLSQLRDVSLKLRDPILGPRS
jgi:hypothetical protein